METIQAKNALNRSHIENELETDRKHRFAIQQNQALVDQITNQRRLLSLSKEVEKMPAKTNYGPEETEEVVAFIKNKKLESIKQMRSSLEGQMKEKNAVQKDKNRKEKEDDLVNIKAINEAHESEENSKKRKEKEEKMRNKVIWQEQAQQKEWTRQFENEV